MATYASKVREETLVNWLWPGKLNSDDRVWVRIVRFLHWFIVGIAVFGLIVDFVAMFAVGDGEPVTYVAVVLMWLALAMFGRGLRYVLVRE